MKAYVFTGEKMVNKKTRIFFVLSSALPLQTVKNYDTQSESSIDISGILISFLYLAAVLVMIYIILLLINKAAKKYSDRKNHEESQKQKPDNDQNIFISDEAEKNINNTKENKHE